MVLPSSQVSEAEVELVREVVLGAGRLCMVAKMVVMLVAMLVAMLVPILAPETQTSDIAPAQEMLEYSPASM